MRLSPARRLAIGIPAHFGPPCRIFAGVPDGVLYGGFSQRSGQYSRSTSAKINRELSFQQVLPIPINPARPSPNCKSMADRHAPRRWTDGASRYAASTSRIFIAGNARDQRVRMNCRQLIEKVPVRPCCSRQQGQTSQL